MRQFICIFSAFALLIGCVKIDPTTTTGQESEAVIAFDCPIVAPKAKSVEEFRSYPDDLHFRVWGYYSESNAQHILSNSLTMYMNGAEFSKQGNTWASVGKNYYWPKSGYLDFVAYAPATLQVALTDADPTFKTISGQDYVQFGKYTVPDKADEDLLISDVEYGCTKPGVENAGAPLRFHHVLSSVVFKVNSSIYGDRDNVDPNRVDTDLRVTKIEILQVRSRGILNVNMRTNRKSCTTFEGETLKKDFTGYNSDPDKGTGTGTVLTDEFQFCHDMQIAPEKEETHSLTNLILLPQRLLDDVVLRVTYDMTTSTMSEANGTNEEVWIKDQVKTIQMNECGVTEWEVGTRYCYNISLGLNKIQCSAEVSDWSITEITTDVEDLDVEDVVEL